MANLNDLAMQSLIADQAMRRLRAQQLYGVGPSTYARPVSATGYNAGIPGATAPAGAASSSGAGSITDDLLAGMRPGAAGAGAAGEGAGLAGAAAGAGEGAAAKTGLAGMLGGIGSAAGGWGVAPGLAAGAGIMGSPIGQVVLPAAAGVGLGMLANKLTPESQQHTIWSRFLQGAAPGAAVGAIVPGANIITMPAGAAIGGIANVVKSAGDDSSAKDKLTGTDDQLKAIRTGLMTTPSMPEATRAQFNMQLDTALQTLDRNFKDKESGEYADAKKSLVDQAQQLADQTRLQALANPQNSRPTFNAQDKMAMQAVIAEVLGQQVKQANDETNFGSMALYDMANKTGGDAGDQIRRQAILRQQNQSQQNAAFAGSINAQLALQDINYFRNMQNQQANQMLQTMMAQANTLQGGGASPQNLMQLMGQR